MMMWQKVLFKVVLVSWLSFNPLEIIIASLLSITGKIEPVLQDSAVG